MDYRFIFSESWRNVDLIKIKVNKNIMEKAVYYLDGHRMYDLNVSDKGRKLVKFVRENGCYGTSEIVKRDTDGDKIDQMYVRVNLSDKVQRDKIISYLTSDFALCKEQQEILCILKGLDKNIDFSNDYKSLYFLGYQQEIGNEKKNKIKFYFRCIGKNKLDNKYLDYLQQYSCFYSNEIFNSIVELVKKGILSLGIIGVEFDRFGRYKLKFYIEIDNEDYYFSTITSYFKTDKMNMKLKLANEIIVQNQEFNACWLQLSEDYSGKLVVNVYFEGKNKISEKYYSLTNGVVCRNIGGVYFIVDIHEKKYYDIKNLLKTNQIGSVILEYMKGNRVCSIWGIISYVKSKLLNYNVEMEQMIYDDCMEFVNNLVKQGYICEVSNTCLRKK